MLRFPSIAALTLGVLGLAAVALLLAFPLSPAHAQERRSVLAVMPFDVSNAAPAQGAEAARRVNAELAALKRFTLIDHSQSEEFIKGVLYRLEDCVGAPCAQRMGRELGVEKVVMGTLSHGKDDHWTLAVQLVDVGSGKGNPVPLLERDGPFDVAMPILAALAANRLAEAPSPALAAPAVGRAPEVEDEPESSRGFSPRSGWALYSGGVFSSGTVTLESGEKISYSSFGAPNLSLEYQLEMKPRWTLGIFAELSGPGNPSGKLGKIYNSAGPSMLGLEARYWWDRAYIGGLFASSSVCFFDFSDRDKPVDDLCLGGWGLGPTAGYQFANGWFLSSQLVFTSLDGNEEPTDPRVPRAKSGEDTSLWLNAGYRWSQGN